MDCREQLTPPYPVGGMPFAPVVLEAGQVRRHVHTGARCTLCATIDGNLVTRCGNVRVLWFGGWREDIPAARLASEFEPCDE